MALKYVDGMVAMEPGPFDPHGHPRVFDAIVDHALDELNEYEGKAGLIEYTETALKSGITRVAAMPNEFLRRVNPDASGGTSIIQFPISNIDRALAMEAAIQTQSRMGMSYHLGLDRSEILGPGDEVLDVDRLDRNFIEAGKRVRALKVFGDRSTGGQQIPLRHIPEIISRWSNLYRFKPVILHLEDENVRTVLDEVDSYLDGKDWRIHIAHVSSKEELEAVISAKERDMHVTCEVTPHHLFADSDDGAQIYGYGCMKPTLKSPQDVQFLWDNMSYIDIIASDCAPHRVSDKEADSPAYGITNHTVMLPLLFGAVEAGRLSLEDVYQKTVINPRIHFGSSILNDGTFSVFDLNRDYFSARELEADVNVRYGQNIFPKIEATGKRFRLLGQVMVVHSGQSGVVRDTASGRLEAKFKTSLLHLNTA